MIITIDGPAGSGKSTVASKIAKKLGFIHLNSGALFRAVALKAEEQGVALDDDDAVSELAADTEFAFKLSGRGQIAEARRETRLLVDGHDVSEQVKSPAAGRLASRIAVLPKLREILLKVQREAADGNSVVVEGRDAGTIVFPGADLKFYLDAALEVRARRRFDELRSEAGESVDRVQSLAEVRREMKVRDTRDSTREIAPQIPAEDAIRLDTSDLNVDQVVEQICGLVERKDQSN